MKWMARGWESKNVEEQQSERQAPLTTEAREQMERAAADKARQVQALRLTIARIQEQVRRTENGRYLELLNCELAHLQGELAGLL